MCIFCSSFAFADTILYSPKESMLFLRAKECQQNNDYYKYYDELSQIVNDGKTPIEQLVFTTEDNLSIGIYCKDYVIKSTDEIIDYLLYNIEELNSNKQLQERILTKALELNDFFIDEIVMVENVDCYKPCNIMSSSSSNLTISSGIDSSYHYTEWFDNVSVKKWHNGNSGTEHYCFVSPTEPHCGDGNSRYQNGAHKWYPNDIEVDFEYVDSTKNKATVWYKYDDENLSNLQLDNNETLEIDLVLFNYRDNGFMHSNYSGVVFWSSNQPNKYLDTQFGDESDETVFCVGEKNALSLNADTWYFWSITAGKGTSDNGFRDGFFKIQPQRGYRLIAGSAWTIFKEEHEPALSLGAVSDANSWALNGNAYNLASRNDTWYFNDLYDYVKVY